MFLTVPTNWDDELLAVINEINSNQFSTTKVGQIYGTVKTNVGDGRLDTPTLPENQIRNHIRLIHEMGIPFNFLLNGPSMGGIEHDHAYRNNILDLIKWVEDIGADMITVSNPFLGEIIQYHNSNVKIKISTIVDVKTVQSIKLLEQLGPKVNSITLSFNINREFEILKKISESANFQLELLANIPCLLNCPFQHYHYDLVGNSARLGNKCLVPFEDYRPLACDIPRLTNLGEIARIPWIRPEDIPVYDNFGISSIKLAGRTWPTPTIIRLILAYSRGYYDGNLWDLIAPWMPIHVENKHLDGFVDFFVNKNFYCSSNCGTCSFCEEIAERSIRLKSAGKSYLEDAKTRIDARLDARRIPDVSMYSPDAFFEEIDFGTEDSET